MPIALTEAATFDTSVSVPEDGIDDETAASLVPAFQSLANRTHSLKPIYDAITSGGSLEPAGDLSIFTATGSHIGINDMVADSNADGGAVHCVGAGGLTVDVGGITAVGNIVSSGTVEGAFGFYTGRVRFPKGVVIASTSAGTYTFTPGTCDHVYNEATTSGVVWKLSSATPNAGECMRFVNFNTAPIDLQDSSGSVIVTLKYVSGFQWATTIAYISGSWVQIDRSIHN
jgi:hypothetical protein